MEPKISIITPKPTNSPIIRELFQGNTVPPHCNAIIKQINALKLRHILRRDVRNEEASSVVINPIQFLMQGAMCKRSTRYRKQGCNSKNCNCSDGKINVETPAPRDVLCEYSSEEGTGEKCNGIDHACQRKEVWPLSNRNDIRNYLEYPGNHSLLSVLMWRDVRLLLHQRRHDRQ
jgi:hypothetical protein